MQCMHRSLKGSAHGGWADWTPALPDDEILRRLLALNLAARQR